MKRHEWYRRKTWSAADEVDFFTRLSRSREDNRPQYLAIQAHELAETGAPEALATALTLIDRLFSDFPNDLFTRASALLCQGDCLVALGRLDEGLTAYRASLQTEREYPNVRTTAWLQFGWTVISHRRTDCYEEAVKVIAEYRDDDFQLPRDT